MIWYLLMTESIVTSYYPLIREVNKDVQSGDIALKINKPCNYVLYNLALSLSYRIVALCVTFAMGAVIVYLMVGGIEFSLSSLPFLAIVILLAFILDFLIEMILSLMAFWFEDTESFKWIYDKILFVIGGMLLPLEILPGWLAKISESLPFSYIVYYPAKLFVSFDINLFWKVIGIQIAFIALFVFITFIVYRIVERRLNVNGG
jgi:ABC-2 type transport system permease protein